MAGDENKHRGLTVMDDSKRIYYTPQQLLEILKQPTEKNTTLTLNI